MKRFQTTISATAFLHFRLLSGSEDWLLSVDRSGQMTFTFSTRRGNSSRDLVAEIQRYSRRVRLAWAGSGDAEIVLCAAEELPERLSKPSSVRNSVVVEILRPPRRSAKIHFRSDAS